MPLPMAVQVLPPSVDLKAPVSLAAAYCVCGVVGSTASACRTANRKLSTGDQVLPPSVLFHRGRAPSVGWTGLRTGKSTDVVSPATYADPVESTAMAAGRLVWLPPKFFS